MNRLFRKPTAKGDIVKTLGRQYLQRQKCRFVGPIDATCKAIEWVHGLKMMRIANFEHSLSANYLNVYRSPSNALSSAGGKFSELAEQWRRETCIYSNISKKWAHPAYQRIIGMGYPAVPLILRDMETNGPDHWFWALTSITGVNPITEDMAGNMAAMTGAWLEWGKNQGYLTDSQFMSNPISLDFMEDQVTT